VLGGGDITLDPARGAIDVGGKRFTFPPLPPEIRAISEAGGLLEFVRLKLRKEMANNTNPP